MSAEPLPRTYVEQVARQEMDRALAAGDDGILVALNRICEAGNFHVPSRVRERLHQTESQHVRS